MKYESLFEEGSLWPVIAALSIWAGHFLLCYWVAAVWCAKYAVGEGSLLWVRIAIGLLTVAALGALAWLAWHAVHRYRGRLEIEDDLVEDSESERTRFLGHATLLLCSLSAVAIVFDVVPALVFATCR